MIHTDIIDRYDSMLRPYGPRVMCIPNPGTYACHLRWMLNEMRKPMPLDKANRWLGFVQGCVIARGLTTVARERDFTRPYFATDTQVSEAA